MLLNAIKVIQNLINEFVRRRISYRLLINFTEEEYFTGIVLLTDTSFGRYTFIADTSLLVWKD